MKNGRLIGVVAAALVVGLVVGNMGSALAATTATGGTAPSVASTVAACGTGIGRTMRDAGGRLLDVVASLTGKNTEDIRAERADGKTFAQIAEANGSSAEDVVSKALEIRRAGLDEAVKDGTITQEQADAAYATMKTRLADRVTSTTMGRGNGGGMGRGRGGNGGGMGGACGGACGGSTTAAQ